MSRLRHRLAAAGAGLGLLLAAGTFGTAPAQAHSELVSSNPAQGARLQAAPEALTLTFSTAMKAPATVALTAPDGARLSVGEPSVKDRTVTVSLPPTDQQGAFTFAFRAFSSDGHQVTGQIGFTVGEASALPSPSGSAPTAASTPSTASTASTASTESASPASNPASPDGFWSRHWWQFLIGALLFGGAAVLEAAARRSNPRA